MKALSVIHGATPTLVAAAGNRNYLHIYNNSDTTIYLSYDGSATTVSTANGMPLKAGTALLISNDSMPNVYNNAVYAVHGDAAVDKELRLMGVE